MATPQIITARIRGFLCVNAHPTGCAANVDRQIQLARAAGRGSGIRDALVIGGSTGYGLSSLITTMFGYGARALNVCLERPPHGDKSASAGWYNLAAVKQRARDAGLDLHTVNGDAYSNEIKAETIAHLQKSGAKLDSVVYSLASPRRLDPTNGQSYASVLKPVGAPYASKSINLNNDQVVTVEIPPASNDDIDATIKVMGGEDWALWMRDLLAAGLLAEGCRAVAYSYIGPQLTYPIYRSGTIGKAKEHLERTARALDAELQSRLGGRALVSVDKALVTQASAAIPVVPLYISILYKVMKAKGTHEGTIEQVVRLFRDHLAPGVTPTLDEESRIRIDDWELDPGVQAAVSAAWAEVTTENLFALSDFAGFKQDFRSLFGFDVPGVDYSIPVDTDVSID
ncbi:MAG: trans-2-enoyl-CoA reductase family protein [Deltaproteobacteria bacterium]|nr:trans-2-enoyl-CoA reductase family protein [Deltaproteobacteria bacterium]